MGKQARVYMSQAAVAPPSEPARQANLNEHTHIGILDQALCLILIFVKKNYVKIMPKSALFATFAFTQHQCVNGLKWD